MENLLILLGFLLGGIGAKLSAFYIASNLNLKNFKNVESKRNFYIFFPLSSFFLKNNFLKKEIFPILFLELFGMVLGGAFVVSILKYISTLQLNFAGEVFMVSIFLVVTFTLLFLSVFDILTLSVPTNLVKSLYIFTILINLFIALLKLLSLRFGWGMFVENVPLGGFDNLICALLLSLLVWLLSKLTKESAMGMGDVDIAGIVGIMLGWPNIIAGFMYTLYVGGFVGIIYMIFLKKFRDTLVPFVPIITLGFVLSLGFYKIVTDLFLYGVY
ncbi:MAG: hypothetical protein KatS3mg085_393 [Candidatus Dojkabacteria bacterium]|nr:MAG: hypothetical protein KatS3mg085_393 [Candidatus Dojkabacteria bacterium]